MEVGDDWDILFKSYMKCKSKREMEREITIIFN